MPDKIEFATKVQKIFEQYKNEIDESLDEVLKEVGKKNDSKVKRAFSEKDWRIFKELGIRGEKRKPVIRRCGL